MWIHITEEQFFSLREDLGDNYKTKFYDGGKYIKGATYSVAGNDMLQYERNTHTKKKSYFKNNEFVL